jgi:serine/threonine protein phosphatase PrpC
MAAADGAGKLTVDASKSSPAAAAAASALSPSVRNAEVLTGQKQRSIVFGNERKGAKQWQEDAFFYYRAHSGRIIVAAIFDGHGGYNGLVASTTARDAIAAFVREEGKAFEAWAVEEWKQRLVRFFDQCHSTIRERFLNDRSQEGVGAAGGKRVVDEKGIVRTLNGDPVHGGSTATIVIVIRHDDGGATVVCANTGDSAALVMPRGKGRPEFLTVDHGPENADEFKRVSSLSDAQYPTKLMFVYDKANVFRKYECPPVFLANGTKDPVLVQNPWANGLHPTNVRYEPAVYAVTPRHISKDTTCIAMTRALGDFYAHQFGLTHVPSVQVKVLEPKVAYTITVASDGIWDCWKYEDLMEFVNQKLDRTNNDVEAVVEYALSESIQRAVTNFGAKHYDDASLICILLDGNPPTKDG